MRIRARTLAGTERKVNNLYTPTSTCCTPECQICAFKSRRQRRDSSRSGRSSCSKMITEICVTTEEWRFRPPWEFRVDTTPSTSFLVFSWFTAFLLASRLGISQLTGRSVSWTAAATPENSLSRATHNQAVRDFRMLPQYFTIRHFYDK